MVDGVILVAVVVPAIIGLFVLMFQVINNEGGTKGIEQEPYYGRKTGKIYTAEKSREHHIV